MKVNTQHAKDTLRGILDSATSKVVALDAGDLYRACGGTKTLDDKELMILMNYINDALMESDFEQRYGSWAFVPEYLFDEGYCLLVKIADDVFPYTVANLAKRGDLTIIDMAVDGGVNRGDLPILTSYTDSALSQVQGRLVRSGETL